MQVDPGQVHIKSHFEFTWHWFLGVKTLDIQAVLASYGGRAGPAFSLHLTDTSNGSQKDGMFETEWANKSIKG